MIMNKGPARYIVNSRPGQGTGETIYEDNEGRFYRPITEAEAQTIRNSTTGRVWLIHSNGTVS